MYIICICGFQPVDKHVTLQNIFIATVRFYSFLKT